MDILDTDSVDIHATDSMNIHATDILATDSMDILAAQPRARTCSLIWLLALNFQCCYPSKVGHTVVLARHNTDSSWRGCMLGRDKQAPPSVYHTLSHNPNPSYYKNPSRADQKPQPRWLAWI